MYKTCGLFGVGYVPAQSQLFRRPYLLSSTLRRTKNRNVPDCICNHVHCLYSTIVANRDRETENNSGWTKTCCNATTDSDNIARKESHLGYYFEVFLNR